MEKMKWRVLSSKDYRAKAEQTIIGHESNVSIVYLDPVGIPTTGPGKALVVKGYARDEERNIIKDSNGRPIMKWVISEGRDVEGVETLEKATGQKLTPEQREKLQAAADNLNRYGRGDDAYEANQGVFYNKPISKNDENGRVNPQNSTFGVRMNESQQNKFKDLVIDASEKDLDNRLGMKGKDAIPLSEERAALLSVVHQEPGAITKDVGDSLKKGDRAAVIQQIESNPEFAKRRKKEADQFGRPEDPVIIRHENNSQADMEGILKSPQQALPTEKFPSQQPTGPAKDANPTTVTPPSILDYLGTAAGKVGGAISTIGHVAFDTALGLGKETLTQTIRLALTQGNGGKAMLQQAAQLAVGNMLASMHAQIVQQGIQQAGWPTGIAGPLQRPIKPVEQVMNDPRNQNVFERMAREVQRLLGIYPDLDPAVIMADQGLKHIRQGDIKIPQGILLPDMLPMDKPKGSEPRIDILGVSLPVGWPEIGVIHENPNAHPSAAGQPADIFAFRDGEGVVQVASYSRGGITVKAHSRSKPDGDVTNNLSYKFKV